MKKEPLFFRLVNLEIVANCFQAITELLAKEKTVFVTLETDESRVRTLAQNRLYWLWVKTVADELGNDKDSQHLFFKRHLLAKIYARDDGDFAKFCDEFKQTAKHLDPKDYQRLAQGVARLLTTTTASIEQFTEYLQDIEKWAYQSNIRLPMPQELIWAIR